MSDLLHDGKPPPVIGTYVMALCKQDPGCAEGGLLLVHEVCVVEEWFAPQVKDGGNAPLEPAFVAYLDGWLFRVEQDGCRYVKNVEMDSAHADEAVRWRR